MLKDESLLMKRVIARSAPKETPDNTLPEVLDIDLETFTKAYPDWLRWRALDKLYPPNVIRKNPRWLLDAFIYMDMLLEKMIGDFHQKHKPNGK